MNNYHAKQLRKEMKTGRFISPASGMVTNLLKGIEAIQEEKQAEASLDYNHELLVQLPDYHRLCFNKVSLTWDLYVFDAKGERTGWHRGKTINEAIEKHLASKA